MPISKEKMDSLEMPKETTGVTPYRNLLGELGWVAMCSRPDVILCVRLMASYAGKHNESHYMILLCIAKYLHQTMEYGPLLKRPAGRGQAFSKPMQITCWCQ